MGEQTAAALRWQHSTRAAHGGRARRMSVCLYVSVPGILASPNTGVPCPCVVLTSHWTVNAGALPSDALFMCSFCTGSASWPSITAITVMSTQQTHWLTAQPAAICCPYSVASKPTVQDGCCRAEQKHCKKMWSSVIEIEWWGILLSVISIFGLVWLCLLGSGIVSEVTLQWSL